MTQVPSHYDPDEVTDDAVKHLERQLATCTDPTHHHKHHRHHKGALDNPRCPDYWAHQENVSERLFSGQDVLDQDQDEQVSREAEREYTACEGHDVGSRTALLVEVRSSQEDKPRTSGSLRCEVCGEYGGGVARSRQTGLMTCDDCYRKSGEKTW
jgi:hypothetical protein